MSNLELPVRKISSAQNGYKSGDNFEHAIYARFGSSEEAAACNLLV